MKTEPVAVGGAFVGLLNALISLAALIWQIGPELTASLNGVAVATIAVVTVLVRSKVEPVNG